MTHKDSDEDDEHTMRSISQVLAASTTIAVVGASRDQGKAAHRIPLALQRMGYRIIPVNPLVDELFGEQAYASLGEVPEPIDIVDVFRPADQAPAVAHAAVAAGARVLWLQLGIVSLEARAIAAAAGIDFVEDACLMVEARARGIDKT